MTEQQGITRSGRLLEKSRPEAIEKQKAEELGRKFRKKFKEAGDKLEKDQQPQPGPSGQQQQDQTAHLPTPETDESRSENTPRALTAAAGGSGGGAGNEDSDSDSEDQSQGHTMTDYDSANTADETEAFAKMGNIKLDFSKSNVSF